MQILCSAKEKAENSGKSHPRVFYRIEKETGGFRVFSFIFSAVLPAHIDFRCHYALLRSCIFLPSKVNLLFIDVGDVYDRMRSLK